MLTVLLAALLILALFIYFYRRSKEAETTRLREAQQQLQAELEQLTVQQKEILQQQARAICQSGQKDRLQRIIEVFEAAYPHAMEKLGVACPELNRSERNLIVLSFLGLRIKEEADLLGLSENTVMKYRSNLKNRAGLELISALLD